MSDGRPRGRKMSTRTRSIIYGVLSVVVLAGVILAVGALTSPKRPDAALPPVAKETPAVKLYGQAISALESGDATGAVTLLKKAAAAGSVEAGKKLQELQGQQPKPESISLTNTTPSGSKKTTSTAGTGFDEGYTAERDASAMLPTVLSGYSFGAVDAGEGSALVPVQPTTPATMRQVDRVVFSVIDEGTTAKAVAYVDGIAKAYPQHVKSVKVGAAAVPGKSGDDGRNAVSVVFHRGRYVFEVVVTAPDGAAPSDASSVALQLAGAFPSSKSR